MENKTFWNSWFKFVGILVLIFVAWLSLIFICDWVFGPKFEKFKFIHYFILLAVIVKARKHFIDKINSNNDK